MSEKMWHVTLAELRANDPCVSGYNKVVCMSEGIPYKYTSLFIRSKNTDEIPLAKILGSNDLDDTLWAFRVLDNRHEDDVRMFAAWIVENYHCSVRSSSELAPHAARAVKVARDYVGGYVNSIDISIEYENTDQYSSVRYLLRQDIALSLWHMYTLGYDTHDEPIAEMMLKMFNGEAPWQLEELK